MLLPHGIVIALVDGENFKLFRNTGDDSKPQLTAMPSPKLVITNHSAAGHRTNEGNPDKQQSREDAHASAVVDWLNSEVLGHKIEKLVVFASPRTLGEMRRHYHKQTEKAVLKEIPKDYVERPLTDIIAALREKH